MATQKTNVITVAALGVVIAGAVTYTVIASREAAIETANDADIQQHRLEEHKGGFLGSGRPTLPGVQPTGGCNASTIEALNAVVRRTHAMVNDPTRKEAWVAVHNGEFEAVRLLSGDPGCAQVARVLAIFALYDGKAEVRRVATDVFERARTNPTGAGHQLAAAYLARALGDGKAFRRWLDAAEAANPAAPLLHHAQAFWWEQFADPRDYRRELDAFEAEVAATGDDASLHALAKIHSTLGEVDKVETECRQLTRDLPPVSGLALTCLYAAIERDDAPAETAWRDAYLSAANPDVSAACRHADIAGALLSHSCRTEDALAEAELAIEQGCPIPGNGHRRTALLRAGRYDEAAAAPPGGEYWHGVLALKDQDPDKYFADERHRATALAMVGQTSEARTLLTRPSQTSPSANVLLALIEDGQAKEVLHPDRCSPPKKGNERLAGVAGLYNTWGMNADARKLLETVLAADPKSMNGRTNMVYVLMVEKKLDEAIAMAESAVADGAEDAMLLQNLGFAYQEKGLCEKAIPVMQRSAELNPWSDANYTNLARCLDTVGRSDEAAKYWRYIIGGAPRATWWLYALLVVGALGTYFGSKLALIRLMPKRFGHLKFP